MARRENPSRQNTGICQLLRARERAALVALRKSQAPVPRIGPARIAHQRKECGSALETKWYCDSSPNPRVAVQAAIAEVIIAASVFSQLNDSSMTSRLNNAPASGTL